MIHEIVLRKGGEVEVETMNPFVLKAEAAAS